MRLPPLTPDPSYRTPTKLLRLPACPSPYPPSHLSSLRPPQATLRAREAISLYYDCTLIADDETAPLESRDVVLRPLEQQEGGGPRSFDCCPHPDPAKTGVVMTRAVSERKLYLQVGGGGAGGL